MISGAGPSIAAACLLVVAAAYQVSLAAGAPWSAAAYSGRAARRAGPLPTGFRVASAGAAVVLVGAGWWVLAAASVVGHVAVPAGVLQGGLWCLVAFFGLNTVGNLAARHWFERGCLSVVTLALTVLVAVVALR